MYVHRLMCYVKVMIRRMVIVQTAMMDLVLYYMMENAKIDDMILYNFRKNHLLLLCRPYYILPVVVLLSLPLP